MKRYIPRRALALLVSVAMVLSMLCSAFAVETDGNSTNTSNFSDESSISEALTPEEEAEDNLEDESEDESDESASESEDAPVEEEASEDENPEEEALEDENPEENAESDSNKMLLTASNEVDDLIYVDDELYDGYYMDADGVLYNVASGVATAVNGVVDSKTQYYKDDGTGYTNNASNLLYIKGTLYTGYYYNVSQDCMYTCENGTFETTGDFLSSGKTYYKTGGVKATLSSGAVYVKGKLYTGYFMNSGNGKIYKCEGGTTYALFSGVLASGTEYYKAGSGYVTTSANKVYVKGALYTGYYYNVSQGRMYTCKSGDYEATGNFLSSGTTYSKTGGSSATLSSGAVYVNGYLYTGYFVNSGNGKMYKCENGTTYALFSGVLASGTKYYKAGSGYVTNSDNKVYVKGALYTGYYYNVSQGRMYTCKSGDYEATGNFLSSGTTYCKTGGSSATLSCGTVYVNGYLYTGYFMNSGNDKMYYCTNGTTITLYTGTLSSGTKYYLSGTGYVTLSEAVAYKSGVAQISGWKFSNDYAYYYVNGTKVTGWYYIKRNGTKYKYYFDPSDGHLVTNLYAYFGSSYRLNRCKLVINLKTYNASILGYDSATDSYCVPYYSFIIGISKTGEGPQAGTTYTLANNREKWFTFADNGKDYYYAYATLISGSGGYIHSERYSTNGNLNTLVTSTYNGLGTKQSSKCIRAQLYVARLIYNIRMYNTYTIKVQVVSNSTYGPFGKITLSSTTGKISSSTKSDPTGVSSYEGYIKQTAE